MIVAAPYNEVNERRTITMVGAILAEIVAILLIIYTSAKGHRSGGGSAGYIVVGDLIYVALIVIAAIGIFASYNRNQKFAKVYLYGIIGLTGLIAVYDVLEGVLEAVGLGCSGCNKKNLVLAIILAVVTVGCCCCCIITAHRFNKAFNTVGPSSMIVEMYANPQVVQPQPYSTQPYPPMYQGAGVATVGMPVPEDVANSFQPAYAQPMGQPMYNPQNTNQYPQYPVQPPMQSMGAQPCA